MTSIFSIQLLNEQILELKNLLNVITPEFLGAHQDVVALNNLHRVLIEKKKDINGLRNTTTLPSDLTDIEMYSDAFGDKIILVENRIQALQNVDAAANVEVGGRRRRRRTKRRRNKGSKGSKRRRI